MTTNSKYVGLWWLPSNAEEKIAGDLTVTNEGRIQLELRGTFNGILSGEEIPAYPIILGLTDDGKLITICGCHVVSRQFSMPGYEKQILLVERGYIGAHLDKPGAEKFHKAYVEYSYLPDWTGISGFNIDWGTDPTFSYELTYRKPEQAYEAILEDAKITLSHGFRVIKQDFLEEIHLGQSIGFMIDLDVELSMEELELQLIYPLRNLVTLGTARPNSTTKLVVFSKSGETMSAQESSQRPIEVIMRSIRFGREARLVDIEMLFTLDDLKDEFGEVVKRWMQISEQLAGVCDLFFGVQYSPDLILVHEFLFLTQAAEGFHRLTKPERNRVLEPRDFKERKKAILDCISKERQEWKEWITQKLAYANEPSLRMRIEDLFEDVAEVISPLVRSQEWFARMVAEVRNRHIHPSNQEDGKMDLSWGDIYRLKQVLSFLLQMCFLLRLGFPQERAAGLMRRNFRYRSEVDQRRLLS